MHFTYIYVVYLIALRTNTLGLRHEFTIFVHFQVARRHGKNFNPSYCSHLGIRLHSCRVTSYSDAVLLSSEWGETYQDTFVHLKCSIWFVAGNLQIKKHLFLLASVKASILFPFSRAAGSAHFGAWRFWSSLAKLQERYKSMFGKPTNDITG
jgi:hypothetical protein